VTLSRGGGKIVNLTVTVDATVTVGEPVAEHPRHTETAVDLRPPAEREAADPAGLRRPGRTTISAFLNLETDRNNSVRTRNVRLTAMRSLFSFAALRHPEHALPIQQVLAIPPKRLSPREFSDQGGRYPGR
jgi:hypothetical protein